ncbi:MAG: DUF456 domain-containing protein [bacterium]|nr:DUF456 domain-containing protein [bacterium]
MKNKQHRIDHPSQLNALSLLPIMRTRGLGTLRLQGEIAEHASKEAWERDLNKHYYACGCSEGAKGLLLGLLAGSAYAFFAGSGQGVGAAVGTVVGAALVGAVLGKVLGLLRARTRLRQTIREIQEQWQVEPTGTEEGWACG